MQYSVQVAAVGNSKIINEPNIIRSIRIDNNSGMWLYVEECNRYIAPNIQGWVGNPTPADNNVHIDFVNALSGGAASTVTGGPILVSTYQVNQPDSEGTNYTVATQQDLANVLATLEQLTNNTGVLNTLLINTLALTAAAITTINVLPPGSLQLATLIYVQNPSTNPESIWVADDQWGAANSVRNNGFEVKAGGSIGWVTRTTNMVLTTTSVDFSVRRAISYVEG